MRNSKLVFSAALAASAIIGVAMASAADLPTRTYTKAPVIVADPAYNWTGFYVGVNGGYGWQDPTVILTPNDPNAGFFTSGGVFGGTAIPPASYTIAGALGGGQIGYNWQINAKWLLGLEADFEGANIKGTGTSNFLFGSAAPQPSNVVSTQTIDWFGTVRARAGWLPTDKLLFFATGGLAYGQVKESVSINSPGAFANGRTFPFGFSCIGIPTNCFVGGTSRNAVGWTVGVGAEYAVWKNVSLKAEYLYVDLGNPGTVNVVAVNANGVGFSPSSFTAHYSDTTFNVVRAGLSLRF